MEAAHAQADTPEGAQTGSRPVRIIAADDVRQAIRERGGALYVWTDVHGVCEGKVTLLQAATQRPPDERLRFHRIDAGDFVAFLSIGSLLWPEFLELGLHGRRKKIRAYWNGRASVG